MARSSIALVSAVVGIAWALGGCGGGGGGGSSQQISFTAAAFSVNENGTPIAAVTVRRTGGSSGAVSATITLTDGTATGGTPPLTPPADYDNTPIVVTFADGDAADKVVNVAVLDDNTVEGTETATLSLGSPTGGATIGFPATAVLTIVDDDSVGTLQFSAPSYSYDESGTAVVAITVQRVGGIDGAVSALVTSTDGTANSDPNSRLQPVDYTPLSTVVSFADQDGADMVVPVAIVQDQLPELDETFTVSLSQATGGAGIGVPSTATVTIIDDDTLLTIQSPIQASGVRFGTSVAPLGRRMAIGSPGAFSNIGRVNVFDMATVGSVGVFDYPFSQPVQWGSTLGADSPDVLIGVNTGGNQGVTVFDAYTLALRFGFGNAGGLGACFAVATNHRVAIGAPLELGAISQPKGAFYVFEDLTGQQLQTVPGQDGTAEMFGSSMALLGTDLLVGGSGGDGIVRKYSGEPFALTLVITDPFPNMNMPDNFGSAVASIDGKILVGATHEDLSGMDAGLVYVCDGMTGGILQTIMPPVVVPSGFFGSRIIVIGERICVTQMAGGPLGSGVVYVFDHNGALVQTITDPTPTAGANFGFALGELYGALVVGAPMQNVGPLTSVGVVYVFKLN